MGSSGWSGSWNECKGSPMPDPSPDTPSVCPTCGSDDPAVCDFRYPHAWGTRATLCCQDDWHHPATPAAPGSSSPDTAALVAELRQVAARGGFSDDYAEIDLDPEDKRNLRAAADALEAQAARITELEAAVAERNSLIGWLIMAKSCADHGQAPVWPLPAQLEELFQQLSVSVRDDWDDWRWRGITPADHTPSPPPTEETTE